VTGGGIVVKAGQGVVLLTDVDVHGAEPGLAGLLELLGTGLPAILS
jgi:hypothetical protein